MNINLWIDQLAGLIAASQQAIGLTLKIIGILWLVQCVNVLVGYRLNLLGICPRKWYGLPGIVCSPFLHGGFNHLFFNSVPLLILVNLTLLYGVHTFISLTIFIFALSGLATWLLARPGIHVGASSVLMGYWGFLLMQSIFQPSVMTIIVALLCFYYLGSLWMNLMPSGPGVSWEGHVFGCLAGVAGAFIF
jgi:membrane associated rhomboid family serine protease